MHWAAWGVDDGWKPVLFCSELLGGIVFCCELVVGNKGIVRGGVWYGMELVATYEMMEKAEKKERKKVYGC